jgi:hypothetical protein
VHGCTGPEPLSERTMRELSGLLRLLRRSRHEARLPSQKKPSFEKIFFSRICSMRGDAFGLAVF